MASREERLNPTTMTDVTLVRIPGDWDSVCITIVNGDDEDLDNLLHAGWLITGIVTIL